MPLSVIFERKKRRKGKKREKKKEEEKKRREKFSEFRTKGKYYFLCTIDYFSMHIGFYIGKGVGSGLGVQGLHLFFECLY